MRDFCDGDLFSAGQHPLLSVHEKAIQLILYNDDFEVANPLGSKATVHKIGIYVGLLYITFIDFYSKYRSCRA